MLLKNKNLNLYKDYIPYINRERNTKNKTNNTKNKTNNTKNKQRTKSKEQSKAKNNGSDECISDQRR